MNGTNAIVSKKVMPLVAVLILCAACLVTVAYAYNASYQDTIGGEQVPVEETSKYIYITGSGLSYPNAEKFKATTSVQYDTVTTSQGITATPTDFEITGLVSTDSDRPVTYADGIATIKIGDITINNKNTNLVNVYVTVSSVTPSALPDGKVPLFKGPISAGNIYMKVNGADDYSNVFKLTNNAVTVGVYLVAAVDTTPEVLGVNTQPVAVNDQGELAKTVQSILYVPEFEIAFAATAGDNLTIVSGEITTADITSIKESAASNPNFSAKVINDNGASIVMDSTAIALLGNDAAELEIVASDLQGYAKAYEIEFGDNHFGNGNLTITVPYEGQVTEPIMIAYLNNGVVDEVYEATYANGFITFTTSHLSTYAVGTGALADNMEAKLVKDGVTTYYSDVTDAIKNGRSSPAIITLLKDATNTKYFAVGNSTDLTLNLNGKTLTSGCNMFYVADETAMITIDGTVEGSKIICNGNSIVFNDAATGQHKFDLVVIGGTYSGKWLFTLYNADTVSITDATFDATEAAVWCGNFGANQVAISGVKVNSTSTGIYLGTVKDATLRNNDVTASETALEIKSGNVKIVGGTYTGGNYDVSDKIVNHNGTGGASAVIVINNGYCNEAAVNGVNVTMDNVTLAYSDATIEGKPIVVYTDVDDKAQDKDISVSWTDNSANIAAFYNGTSSDIVINGSTVAKQ